MDIIAIGIAGASLACTIFADFSICAFSVAASTMVCIGARIERSVRAYGDAILANAILAIDVLTALDIASTTVVSVRSRID